MVVAELLNRYCNRRPEPNRVRLIVGVFAEAPIRVHTPCVARGFLGGCPVDIFNTAPTIAIEIAESAIHLFFCCYEYFTGGVTCGNTLQTPPLCLAERVLKVRTVFLKTIPSRIAQHTLKSQIEAIDSLVRHNPFLIGKHHCVTDG